MPLNDISVGSLDLLAYAQVPLLTAAEVTYYTYVDLNINVNHNLLSKGRSFQASFYICTSGSDASSSLQPWP